ncbi:MAG: monooxygenase family protein [Isosphaeraceae bacterium]
MNQTVAWQWPEGLEGGFCMIRLGIIARRVWAMPYVLKFRKAIDRSARVAASQGAGLYKSELIIMGWNHFGYIQHWKDVDSLLAWSHAEPHTNWWKEAAERQRRRGDFSIYHETYIATPNGFEAIYLGLGEWRPGASAFGLLVPPKGTLATAKGRISGGTGVLEVTGEAARSPARPNLK